MATIELINELLESGVHYGHQTKRWNPKMKEFILEEKNDIYIIDVSRTVEQIERAGQYLAGIVSGGGKVLFVGCKKQAQEAVKEAAEEDTFPRADGETDVEDIHVTLISEADPPL